MRNSSKRWAVALLLVLAALVFVLPAAAQDDTDDRTITVTGFGQTYGAPDVANIMLGVDAASEDPTEAFNQVNAGVDAVREAVIALGVAPEDIQTSGFNMWAQDGFDPQTGMPTGGRTYRAQNMITVTVRDISITGEVVTAAINAGANSINGLTFGIADTTAMAAESRTEAIADARERAEQIAAALGVTLGDAIRVDESVTSVPLPQAAYNLGRGGGGGDASISEGQLVVSVQLTITFKMN